MKRKNASCDFLTIVDGDIPTPNKAKTPPGIRREEEYRRTMKAINRKSDLNAQIRRYRILENYCNPTISNRIGSWFSRCALGLIRWLESRVR